MLAPRTCAQGADFVEKSGILEIDAQTHNVSAQSSLAITHKPALSKDIGKRNSLNSHPSVNPHPSRRSWTGKSDPAPS